MIKLLNKEAKKRCEFDMLAKTKVSYLVVVRGLVLLSLDPLMIYYDASKSLIVMLPWLPK
jgi:hypothetical protein